MFVTVRRPAYRPMLNNIMDFEREIDSVFGNFLGNTSVQRKSTPAIDIVEKEHETQLVAELPGVAKEDVKIAVENGVLTISGTRKSPALPEKANWVRNEIRAGEFTRTFTLPKGIQLEKIGAELVNGLLTITLPKAEEVKPREIRIS